MSHIIVWLFWQLCGMNEYFNGYFEFVVFCGTRDQSYEIVEDAWVKGTLSKHDGWVGKGLMKWTIEWDNGESYRKRKIIL